MKPKSRLTFGRYRLKSPVHLPGHLKIVLAPTLDGVEEEAFTVLFERKAEYDKPVYRI
ncbi:MULTISPECIES: hypothetical protein [Paenibacillus]|uniref:hypothetical protein n=1 Tax=Paenibacillus TaxID=44249 RepID=UPI000A892536|nr:MULTISPECIES: hypothetical protein [Paenibacillus]GIP22781.1 hypothetical protein J22TS3_30560 [Paenibacillus sp. J22TS3]